MIRAIGGICFALGSVLGVAELIGEGPNRPEGVHTLQIILTTCVQPLVEFIVAATLVFGAGRIASWFHRKEGPENGGVMTGFTALDLYRTFAQLLGIYALLWGVRPLSYVVAALADREDVGRLSRHDVAQFVQAGLYLGFGVVLIVGAGRIAELLARLRHRPPDPPTAKSS